MALDLSTAEAQDAIVAAAQRALGPRWLDLIHWLRDQNQLDEITNRIAMGDIANAVQKLEEAAARYAAAVHVEYVQGAQRVASWLDDKTGIPVDFDQSNTRAIKWMEENKASNVAETTAEAKQTITQVISRGIRAGDNPRVIAEDVRSSIGLTPNMEEWVNNYKTALEVGDWDRALSYELSSGHSDRIVSRLQARGRGETMSKEQINTAVDRYRDNAISYRAEVIARTDALRSVHEGSDEQIRQAIERKDIPADAVIFTWIAGPYTKDSRPDHQALNGTEIHYGEVFVTRGGNQLRFPGDPDAPIEETAQCRCRRTTRLRFGKILEFRKARGLMLPVRLLVA